MLMRVAIFETQQVNNATQWSVVLMAGTTAIGGRPVMVELSPHILNARGSIQLQLAFALTDEKLNGGKIALFNCQIAGEFSSDKSWSAQADDAEFGTTCLTGQSFRSGHAIPE